MAAPSLVGGGHVVRSPVDDTRIVSLDLSSDADIGRRIAEFVDRTVPFGPEQALDALERLGQGLIGRRDELIAMTMRETGFIAEDSRETIDGAIEFLGTFRRFVAEWHVPAHRVPHSYLHVSDREMSIEHRPFRCVGAMVPQNASFNLALTIIAASLYAGSRVVLRPSLQCAGSALLLQEIVGECGIARMPVLIVHSLAQHFLTACFASEDVEMLHYIGSNSHAESVFMGAFRARKMCLIDGQGNGMLYVDGSVALEEAVEIITAGATRYNGETCTSINGVLVAPSVYGRLRERLIDRFRAVRVGHPADPNTQVGPLFSATQAKRLAEALSEGTIACGAEISGGYFNPAVVEGIEASSALAQHGFLGPAVWIQSVADAELFRWIRGNRFPLSDTILSHRDELVAAFAANSRAARITINQDPSIESMFEPWGGYPPSGWNPVSIWIDKYRQAFQLDGQARVVRACGKAA